MEVGSLATNGNTGVIFSAGAPPMHACEQAALHGSCKACNRWQLASPCCCRLFKLPGQLEPQWEDYRQVGGE